MITQQSPRNDWSLHSKRLIWYPELLLKTHYWFRLGRMNGFWGKRSLTSIRWCFAARGVAIFSICYQMWHLSCVNTFANVAIVWRIVQFQRVPVHSSLFILMLMSLMNIYVLYVHNWSNVNLVLSLSKNENTYEINGAKNLKTEKDRTYDEMQ